MGESRGEGWGWEGGEDAWPWPWLPGRHSLSFRQASRNYVYPSISSVHWPGRAAEAGLPAVQVVSLQTGFGPATPVIAIGA